MRYQVWLKQAKYDLSASIMSAEKEYFEWAAYQAEQAVEKALKAVLVHAGWKAPRIHKLGILFGMCNEVNANFKNTKFSFKHIESFTFISRYPFLLPGKDKTPHELISKEDASIAVAEASQIILQIIEILQVKVAPVPERKPEECLYPAEQISARKKQVVKILTDLFDPEKIILFGSYARQMDTSCSGTMDILIIAKTVLPFVERIFQARKATSGNEPIIEPIVYTAEEIEMLAHEGEGFLESVMEEGIVLFEKKPVEKQE